MKKFVLPYKVTQTDVPGKGIYLRGRALGPYGEYAMIVLVIDIISFLLWHPRFYLVYASIGAGLLFTLPYLCRFNIEITRASVLVQTKMIGFVTKEAVAPLKDVVLLHPDFVAANKSLYSSYLKDKDRYLALEFNSELYEPVDIVKVSFEGKKFNLSGGQKEFGIELWDKLIHAMNQLIVKEEPAPAPVVTPISMPAGIIPEQPQKEAGTVKVPASQDQL